MDKNGLFILATTCLLSSSVLAQDSGFYVGGAVGLSNLNQDEPEWESHLLAVGLTGTVDADDSDFGWKFFAGYDFNQYLAVEASYVDLGEAGLDFTVTAPTAISGSGDAEANSFALVAKVSYPFTEQFSLFGRVGMSSWKTEASADDAALSAVERNDDGVGITFGFGAKFDFTDQISLRAEWERFQDVEWQYSATIVDSTVDMFSLGVQFSF